MNYSEIKGIKKNMTFPTAQSERFCKITFAIKIAAELKRRADGHIKTTAKDWEKALSALWNDAKNEALDYYEFTKKARK